MPSVRDETYAQCGANCRSRDFGIRLVQVHHLSAFKSLTAAEIEGTEEEPRRVDEHESGDGIVVSASGSMLVMPVYSPLRVLAAQLRRGGFVRRVDAEGSASDDDVTHSGGGQTRVLGLLEVCSTSPSRSARACVVFWVTEEYGHRER